MKAERGPTTALYPVPVVLVTAGEAETADIITIAWTGTVNSVPPMVSIAVRGSRHSYGLLCSTREFVVNVPRAAQVETVDLSGTESGRDVCKLQDYGLTPLPASHVAPPLIAECPVNLECVVRHQLHLGSHELFLGEVVAVHYDETVLDSNGDLDPSRLDVLAYVAGGYWTLKEQIAEHGYTRPMVTRRERAREAGGKEAGPDRPRAPGRARRWYTVRDLTDH